MESLGRSDEPNDIDDAGSPRAHDSYPKVSGRRLTAPERTSTGNADAKNGYA